MNKVKDNYSIYSFSFARFLMKQGCLCVDICPNKNESKLSDYHTALVYYFVKNELLYDSIKKYKALVGLLQSNANCENVV